MTDMQDRIERAAREISWDGEPTRADLSLAERALRLAFPELFDTPTHWIAPMVATEEMAAAAGRIDIKAWEGVTYTLITVDEATSIWSAMRTAYLNQKDSE